MKGERRNKVTKKQRGRVAERKRGNWSVVNRKTKGQSKKGKVKKLVNGYRLSEYHGGTLLHRGIAMKKAKKGTEWQREKEETSLWSEGYEGYEPDGGMAWRRYEIHRLHR